MDDTSSAPEPEPTAKRRVMGYVAGVVLLGCVTWFAIVINEHAGVAMPWRIAAAVLLAVGLPTYALVISFVAPARLEHLTAPRNPREFLASTLWVALWFFLLGIVQGGRLRLLDIPIALTVGVGLAATYALGARHQRKKAAETQHLDPAC